MLSKSHQSFTKLKPKSIARDKPISNPKDTPIKHTVRTKEKTKSFIPLTKNGFWLNEKNHAFGFYLLEELSPIHPLKFSKGVKHPGLGLKSEKKPIHKSHKHALVKKASHVTQGSKILWVPKQTN